MKTPTKFVLEMLAVLGLVSAATAPFSFVESRMIDVRDKIAETRSPKGMILEYLPTVQLFGGIALSFVSFSAASRMQEEEE